MSPLHRAAARAGIKRRWRDAAGQPQRVADDTLRAILAALGAETLAPPQLITAWAGEAVMFAGRPGHWRITLEHGGVLEPEAAAAGKAVMLPAVAEPGYHMLEQGEQRLTLAVAPRRAYSLADAGSGTKLWGLAVQIYALRRAQDGGIGDFAALQDFACRAAGLGADALALSPVHALFTAAPERYAPYAPSSRAALNVLHIARDGEEITDELIDWPQAATRKLARLRADFAQNPPPPELESFRAAAGPGLTQHAQFEALSQQLGADWRLWPAPYRQPATPEVQAFTQAHEPEIAFHMWLQWRAAQELGAGHAAMRAAGAKIGFITDLAVGTSPAGSHGWSRQEEMLNGLEIGAPPDLFNRQGQGWGITGFSPIGLRRSGYAAFLDMLRQALRQAGGVRIDHIMGLMRLWVIPQGQDPAEGAYLTMPFTDLLRLITLESWRHKAVILGEDLGTLPPGFRRHLSAAGIAGLRVLWFERRGKNFTPPARWSADAAAMSSTHDLPTMAGWWGGQDIAWRQKLGLAAEDTAQRRTDRAQLWAALRASGASIAPQPPEADGAAAATAAAGHIGRAACQLALLPVEDALALPEAPNLPGTTTQHPNWRRRLPASAENIFAQSGFRQNLAALNAARKLPA